MYRARVMPVLQLDDIGLVKTKRFGKSVYVGDPTNAVRIFNDKEVDELILVETTATTANRLPNFELLEEVVSESFVPVTYAGGVHCLEHLEKLFRIGIEKVGMGTAALENPDLVRQAAKQFGNQSIAVTIDVKRNWRGIYTCWIRGGREKIAGSPLEIAERMEQLGAGEILLTSIDREGTFSGYDLDLVRSVANGISIPVVANGGAASLEDLRQVVQEAGASAAAAGSLFVFHGKHRAVLINFPPPTQLDALLRPRAA